MLHPAVSGRTKNQGAASSNVGSGLARAPIPNTRANQANAAAATQLRLCREPTASNGVVDHGLHGLTRMELADGSSALNAQRAERRGTNGWRTNSI